MIDRLLLFLAFLEVASGFLHVAFGDLSFPLKGFAPTGKKDALSIAKIPGYRRSQRSSSSSSRLLAGLNSNEKMDLRRGSTVALVTPFVPETGKVDFASLDKLLDYHLDSGTDNLCILGTTGESAVVTPQERASIVKAVVDKVKGKIPIMVGTGTINPTSVLQRSMEAADLGADASLVVTPYYVKPPQRCLVKHFLDLADASLASRGLPLVVYNVPGRTGVNFLDEGIAICAQHEQIVGVKDATGDLSRVDSLKRALADATSRHDDDDSSSFLLYSGDDGTSAEFCLRGGDGCISVTANVAAGPMHDLMMLALDGRRDEALALDQSLLGLHTHLFCEANPIPTKWACYKLGLIRSPACRPPLDQLDPALEPKVMEGLKQAKLLEGLTL